MADIIPFRGIYYNTNKIDSLTKVVTPPYDVISEEEKEKFYKSHPQNIIRLILGDSAEEENSKNGWYSQAAFLFNKWLSEDILIQDQSPAIYLTTDEFLFENKNITRHGLIALAAIEPFDKGIVLPHERTYSKVKSERLELFKKCHANFSSIFSLYQDEDNNIIKSLKQSVSGMSPKADFFDMYGHRHKIWRIIDKKAHNDVSEAMKEKTIFIADGHHRYETALNYRDWIAENNPAFNDKHPANYVMMYLCSMKDPGLKILPAHRVITWKHYQGAASFVQDSEKYFEISKFLSIDNDRTKTEKEFIEALKSNKSRNTIGVFMKDSPSLYLLQLKQNVMDKMFGNELSEAIKNLDVTVLTRLIFMEILGFNQNMLDDEKLFSYITSAHGAIDKVASGFGDIAFILNPTRIEQVREIAEAGEIMPRKSTYFYPKVITGQLINKITL